jgi:hypothetical protein
MSIPLRSRSSRKVQTNQSNLFPHSLSVYFFLSFDALVSLSLSYLLETTLPLAFPRHSFLSCLCVGFFHLLGGKKKQEDQMSKAV